VAASETEQGRSWAESRIKQLTGGDKIRARFMRQDFFEFLPAFKLGIVGNHQPMLANVDDAMRRRFNIVPFLHRPAKPDSALESKLRAEWPAILRWAIDGCLDWQRHGLTRPKAVVDATENYFADQDMFGQWLGECCRTEPGNGFLKATSAELFGSWKTFAGQAGHPIGTQTAFAAELQKRYFEKSKSKNPRGFLGISLNIVAHDDDCPYQ
jgi:putative DNA primase/helicase